MRIGLLDFHKRPAEGVNLYTLNIATTLRALRPSVDVAIVKLFDGLKVRAELAHDARFAISDYDGVVLSGTDYTHSHRSQLMRTLVRHLVEDAKGQRKTVLGICSGFQLLARAHGFDVEYLPQPESDWYTIRLTDLGRRSPMFQDLPAAFPGFSTHVKQVIVNGEWDGSVLAANANCVHSIVFHEGDGFYIYGTQFHPEDTHASATQYMDEYDPETKGHPLDPDRVSMPETLFGHQLLDNFLKLVEQTLR